MDYKIAFETALRWLYHEVYKDITNKVSYNEAIENKNYAPEYIQDLKLLRRAYLDLKKGDNHERN